MPNTEQLSKFNLFVVSEQVRDSGTFVLLFQDLLNNKTNQAITHDFLKSCLKFPSLIVTVNNSYSRAAEDRLAYIGQVLDYEVCGGYLKFFYRANSQCRQQLINEHPDLFSVSYSEQSNELDYPHWDIKDVCLFEALNSGGETAVTQN